MADPIFYDRANRFHKVVRRFAASGPVNVPVAVEDAARFHDLFGEDVALARDDESGASLFAFGTAGRLMPAGEPRRPR